MRSLFQPIVDLSDGGALVAVEALSRGEQGPLESPTELFAAAAAAGTTASLDAACLRAVPVERLLSTPVPGRRAPGAPAGR